MDAGARGRRLLQRREYKAKVSEFIPKELEDSYKMTTMEANSAQMKAMHDAKMKKMEDDKVAEKKKKKVDEACWKGYEKKGMKTMFGKRYPNCVKKTKKEEVQLEAKYEKGKDRDSKESIRNKRAFGYDRDPGVTKPEVLSGIRKDRHAMRRGVKQKDQTKLNRVVVAKSKRKPFEPTPKGRFKEEVELEAKKSCGEGEYYCHDDQKCKPIPDGMKVGKDGMLVKEDMKGMSQKSGDKRSTESGAGMTAKGVAKYNRRTGGNLKTAVTTPPSKLKPGSKAAKRRKSFCARSRSWTGPRGKAARRRWNCSFEPELPMIIDEKKKLFNTAPLSDRVSNWSKKISEALTPDRNAVGLPKDLKSIEKKVKNLKTGRMNTGGDGTASRFDSYEPQGEMIERKMTSSEKDKKEKYVKGMKKDKGGFTKRYGKDGKSVMYATATKMAMKKEAYGDVPFRDGRVKDYLGKDNIKNIKLTQKGQQAFKTIPDPKIYSGKKLINPDNPITQMYRSLDRVNSSYEPEGEMTEDFYKKKYDVRKGGYQKTNKMTKSNKRSGDSKAQYRQVHKDLAKENALTDFLNNVKKVVNKVNKNQQQKNDAINQVIPGSAGFEKKPIDLKVEGSLHSWFKGSKSKDGKPGWVNVVTGGTCASDKKGEGTPKCVSSSKRASMTKAERLSASRRKKKADPGQQSKSGAAKPTYVATDSKKKK